MNLHRAIVLIAILLITNAIQDEVSSQDQQYKLLVPNVRKLQNNTDEESAQEATKYYNVTEEFQIAEYPNKMYQTQKLACNKIGCIIPFEIRSKDQKSEVHFNIIDFMGNKILQDNQVLDTQYYLQDLEAVALHEMFVIATANVQKNKQNNSFEIEAWTIDSVGNTKYISIASWTRNDQRFFKLFSNNQDKFLLAYQDHYKVQFQLYDEQANLLKNVDISEKLDHYISIYSIQVLWLSDGNFVLANQNNIQQMELLLINGQDLTMISNITISSEIQTLDQSLQLTEHSFIYCYSFNDTSIQCQILSTKNLSILKTFYIQTENYIETYSEHKILKTGENKFMVFVNQFSSESQYQYTTFSFNNQGEEIKNETVIPTIYQPDSVKFVGFEDSFAIIYEDLKSHETDIVVQIYNETAQTQGKPIVVTKQLTLNWVDFSAKVVNDDEIFLVWVSWQQDTLESEIRGVLLKNSYQQEVYEIRRNAEQSRINTIAYIVTAVSALLVILIICCICRKNKQCIISGTENRQNQQVRN